FYNMAKEVAFKYKVIVDGKEVEQTAKSVDDFQKRISTLQTQLNSTPLGTEQWKSINKEIKTTQGAFDAATSSQKSWLQVAAGAPGIVGTLGKSLQGVGQLFGNLNMAFKTSFIGIIATLVAKLIEKFSKMEGVMDPLNKVAGIFSGVMGKIANVILPPIAATLEAVATGAEKLINFFGGLVGASGNLGDELGNLEERQDSLNDTQAEYELGLAQANRQLQEAREIAADSTKPIAERKKALMDAEKIEREIAAKGKERALEQARITAEQIAQSLGLSQAEIKNLRTADAQYLESYAKRIAAQKGLNQEQRAELLRQLGQVEDIAAGEAKIGKKTQAQIDALNKENQEKAKAAAKAKRDARKEEIDAEIKLLTQFQDNSKQKDDQYYLDLKNKLLAYYKEKNALEDKDKKLTAAQIEARRK
ncbi:hypothetical protein EBU24_06660, partial [bacterium]|nr:hypothetical protein [bacterium]